MEKSHFTEVKGNKTSAQHSSTEQGGAHSIFLLELNKCSRIAPLYGLNHYGTELTRTGEAQHSTLVLKLTLLGFSSKLC
jgi:hypothetical protein